MKQVSGAMGGQAEGPFFTVLMNVWNGEDYVAEAIESVLAQDFDDYELLIWDDGSTDRTVEIAQSYSDPRIRCVRSSERMRIGPARNAACKQAKGKWIAFLDQDDLWLPNKLSLQHDAILAGSDRLGLVYGRTVLFGARSKGREFDEWHFIGQQPEGDVFRELLRHPSFIALSSGCIRREAIEEIGGIPPDVIYCPDYFLFLRASRDWEVACVQDVVCRYRVHGTNMSQVYAAQIHAEAFRIGQEAARPGDEDIIRLRTRVVNTLLATETIREGEWVAGSKQLISKGSIAYFAARPFLRRFWRPLRQKWNPLMKYKMIGHLRRLGLLPLADKARFVQRQIAVASSNRRFRAAHPDYVLPPKSLAFDAYNSVDWQSYDTVGRIQAQVFADAMLAHARPGPLAVLEWGCGPGRLVRHLPGMMGTRIGRLAGTDYNPATIDWCKANLPGIEFAENGLMPPLPFEDGSFDVIYNFSVFTHLSESAHYAWAEEIFRLLKPGGIMLSTTHGDAYRYLLTSEEERLRYASGEIVTQAGYEEGKKLYFAVHPPRFVRDRLFNAFEDVAPLPVEHDAMLQTLWLGRRPDVRETAAA